MLRLARVSAALLLALLAGCGGRPQAGLSCPPGQVLHIDAVAGAGTLYCRDRP